MTWHSWVLALAGLLLVGCGRPPGLPLQSDSGVIGRQELPEGTIVVDLAETAEISGLFAKSADGGMAVLVLPPGADQAVRDKPGTISVKVTVPTEGEYRGWLRAKWDDSCGNSVGLKCARLPEKTVGQNAVYDRWHWVDMGVLPLIAGEQTLDLIQREDGVALDQLLLTPAQQFQPGGRVEAGGTTADLRRFGDDFSRSPGHGMDAWTLDGGFELAFSFDPNRIPNQYALVGKSADSAKMATATPVGAPWQGLRIRFAIKPTAAGSYGVLLKHENGPQRLVGLTFGENGAQTVLDGENKPMSRDQARLGQWHTVMVDQWASVTRLFVDGQLVAEGTAAPWLPFRPALAMMGGECVFDDVRMVEIPWVGEDVDQRLPWAAPAEGWYRPEGSERWVLAAGPEAAPMTLSHPDYSPWEMVVSKAAMPDLSDLKTSVAMIGGRAEVSLAPDAETFYKRIAVRFLTEEPMKEVVFGPYHFTEKAIEDPSDYLDFTAEEYEEMKRSGEWDKLKRSPKFRPLVDDNPDEAVWIVRDGWARVRNGVLQSDRRGALVEHFRGFVGRYRVSMRVRLEENAEVILRPYGQKAENGLRVSTRDETGAGVVAVEADTWHAIEMSISPEQAKIMTPAGAEPRSLPAGTKGNLLLGMDGACEVDDLTIRATAGVAGEGLYEFASRETAWWRDGNGWVDHGGISCTLASSWVTLANDSDVRSTSWLKQTMGSDLVVGAYLQEYSEWYGWHSRPTHVHEPYDNVTLCLADRMDVERGYRLEVNQRVDRRRRRTVLYRNGEEVAVVNQERNFPMRFVGSHEPYRPRTNFVRLFKRGGEIVAMVNDREVLRFEDPNPLDVQRVGFGGYQTHVNFCHVEVLGLAE